MFFVTVTGARQYEKQLVGVRLKEVNGSVIITKISSRSLLSCSELVPGGRLVRINEHNCKGHSVQDVQQLFEEAGWIITIQVEYSLQENQVITSTIVKPNPTAVVGISVRDMNGSVVVVRMAKDSLFQDTGLQVGHHIVRLNDQECTSAEETALSLQHAEGKITIISECGTVTGQVSATCTRESSDQLWGLRFRDTSEKSVIIMNIAKDSVFHDSELQVGYQMITVNGYPCTTASETMEIMKRAGHVLTVVAEPVTVVGAEVSPKRAQFIISDDGNASDTDTATTSDNPAGNESSSTCSSSVSTAECDAEEEETEAVYDVDGNVVGKILLQNTTTNPGVMVARQHPVATTIGVPMAMALPMYATTTETKPLEEKLGCI